MITPKKLPHAAYWLLQWVKAVFMYYDASRPIEPKKAMVLEMQREYSLALAARKPALTWKIFATEDDPVEA